VTILFRKITFTLILTISLLCITGCRLLESATDDVGGWDVSACVSGFDTCWNLFWDNSEKFEGGFEESLGELK